MPLGHQLSMFQQRRYQDGHRDGGIRMARDHGSVLRDLAPALRFFEGAARKTAPMRRVRDALNGVLVAGDSGVHDDGGHFGLLNEVLGRASTEINYTGGFRFRDDAGGLHNVADHVESKVMAALIAIGRDADADGAVG